MDPTHANKADGEIFSSPLENTQTWLVRPDPDLADLIPSFLANRQNELAKVDLALGNGDFESIRRVAHTWKGICRPYGFVHLETLSHQLEAAGERESGADVEATANQIRFYLSHVRVVSR